MSAGNASLPPSQPVTDLQGEPLRLGFVPGVMPNKWMNRFQAQFGVDSAELTSVEVDAAASSLQKNRFDAVLMPLPVDSTLFHAIPLYEEQAAVLAPKSHELSLFVREGLAVADLADETVYFLDVGSAPVGSSAGVRPADNTEPGGPQTAAEAVDWVAAGLGLAVLPMPLARLYQRQGVVSVALSDVTGRQIGLVWPRENPHYLIEDLAGIVRGRTANSSRSQSGGVVGATEPKTQVNSAAKSSAKSGGKSGTKSGGKGTGKSGQKLKSGASGKQRNRTSSGNKPPNGSRGGSRGKKRS